MLCSFQGVTAHTALEHIGPFASKPTGTWVTVVLRATAASIVNSVVENRQTELLRQWMRLLGEGGWLLPG